MLISLDRGSVPGLLLQGVKHGVYWRAVRDVRTYSIKGSHHVFAVYLQFFVDTGALDVCRYRNLNGIQPRYNRKTIGPGGLVVGLASEYYDGSPPRHKLQWVETYYGKLRSSARTGKYVGAEMFVAWYPRKRDLRYVTVLPSTFTKYILPSVQYMCNYLSLIAED